MPPSRPILLAALLCAALLATPAVDAATDGCHRPAGSSRLAAAYAKQRKAGLAAYDAGDYATALRRFRSAARYGDKPSQAMLADMLWGGDGTARDRAAGYAWMDLAAERGDRRLLARRAAYWNALSAKERNEALRIGNRLFADYGDHAAKPRLQRKLQRAACAGKAR